MMPKKFLPRLFSPRVIVIFVFFATMLATNWSLLNSYSFHLHDTTHAARISEMARALEDGHFPVRWSQNFGGGYGMPHFQFYAPLAYYVGGVLFLVGVDVVVVFKLLMFLGSAAAFWGAYLLGKELWDWRAGLVTATAFTMAPYRAVDLFVRGALGEVWAISALPFVLLGIVLVVREKRFGLVSLVLGLVGLFLSHNLVTLMFVPSALLFGGAYLPIFGIEKKWKEKEYINRSLKLFFGGFLAIGMSAFYLFPAYFEKEFTRVESLARSFAGYEAHFVFFRQFVQPLWGYGNSAPWPYNDMSYFLGYGQILGLVLSGIFLLLLFVKVLSKRRFSREIFLESMILLLTLFNLLMINKISGPIWESFTIFHIIQFPWRFLSVAVIFVALSAGWLMSKISVKKTLLSILLATIMIVPNIQYFQPENYEDDHEIFFSTDEAHIRSYFNASLSDYLPESRDATLVTNSFLLPHSEDTGIVLEKNLVHEKIFSVSRSYDSKINFNLTDFPGWVAEIDGEKTEVISESGGTVSLEIPEGQHSVRLSFQGTQLRNASDLISLFSWTIFGLLIFSSRIQKQTFHFLNCFVN